MEITFYGIGDGKGDALERGLLFFTTKEAMKEHDRLVKAGETDIDVYKFYAQPKIYSGGSFGKRNPSKEITAESIAITSFGATEEEARLSRKKFDRKNEVEKLMLEIINDGEYLHHEYFVEWGKYIDGLIDEPPRRGYLRVKK